MNGRAGRPDRSNIEFPSDFVHYGFGLGKSASFLCLQIRGLTAEKSALAGRRVASSTAMTHSKDPLPAFCRKSDKRPYFI
jgi:hypothetical protein